MMAPQLSLVVGVSGVGGWLRPPDSLLFLTARQRVGVAVGDKQPMSSGWFTVFPLAGDDARLLASGSARGRIAGSADACDFSWSEGDALLLRLFLRRELRDSI